MNFVAIDFETANEKRNSPCSLGLSVIKDNKVVLEKYWLIRPYEFRFVPMNIMIHGIRPADVELEPEFDELWPEISTYLEGQLVIAHNASFDMSVLRNTLDTYNLPYPNCTYACTMLMSRNYYSFLDDAKLNTVNHYLGYQFAHHNAAADALACANILTTIRQELDTEDIQEIAMKTGIKLGALYPGGYDRCSTKGIVKPSKVRYQAIKQVSTFNKSLIQGQYVAFTGPLQQMTRAQAIDQVLSCGGYYCSSVSKKTTLLVTNVEHPEKLLPEQMSTKLRKAMLLQEKGQNLMIINEEFLYAMN